MGSTYKMTTDIPAGITTPEGRDAAGHTAVLRRLPGRGHRPDVYDNLDFQRACRRLIALPGPTVAIREGYRAFGPDNQTLLITDR